MATLHVLRGANVDSFFELATRREVLLGRDPHSDIVLSDRTISRRHARIFQRDGVYFIEDLNSVNGVAINGRRISEITQLYHQDQIALHDIVFQFLDSTSDAAPPAEHPQDTLGDDESTLDGLQQLGEFVALRDLAAEEHSPAATLADDALVGSGPASGPGARDHAFTKLQAILEITQSLGASLNLAEVLPRILESLFRIFPQARRGYILQRDKPSGELELRAIKHETTGSDTVSPIGGQVAQRVMREGVAFLSSDAQSDDRLGGLASSALDDSEPIRSVMCAPLMGPSRSPLGVIHLETNDPRRPFTQSDLEVLASVAFLAGQAVEYTEIHEELLELDRRNLELDLARSVQLAFLPQRAPRALAYQFSHHYRAAQYVAGDYFEYIELPNGRVAVVVGDVAGHGVSAALTMARLCSDIRYALLTTDTPAQAVSKLNWQLSVQFPDLPFITQVLCVLDDHSNSMTVVNAGHPYPLLRRAGSKQIHELDELGGLPLGVHESMAYEQFTISLEPGDLVMLYTDGVTEAMNRKGDLYKSSRMGNAIVKAGSEPKHVIRAVLNDVRIFTEGRAFHDDVCLVAFLRRPT